MCLIVILAQIGCYVPACFSTLRAVDRIFTRMGTVDNLESNSSTVHILSDLVEYNLFIRAKDHVFILYVLQFMTEMKETAFVIQNVSKR